MLYTFEFSDSDWEEITSLFVVPPLFQHMSRQEWTSIAHMALGKAQCIDDGRYGDDEDDKEWADQLRGIASTILDYFQPGDGKL